MIFHYMVDMLQQVSLSVVWYVFNTYTVLWYNGIPEGILVLVTIVNHYK